MDDIVKKLDRLINDTTAHAMGSVDMSMGPYGKNVFGMHYRKKKKKVRGGASYMMHEDGRNPKAGDRFEYKGKKLTVVNVGSGMGFDKYITVQFDNEKNKRDISMKNFFKGNEFKYIKESITVGLSGGGVGAPIGGGTGGYSSDFGSGQTRVGPYNKRGEIDVIRRQPRPLKFNNLLGAYLPQDEEKIKVEESLKPGTEVKVPHKGKMVTGKIVRYDNKDKHATPFYVVDVGEYESIKVPFHKIKK